MAGRFAQRMRTIHNYELSSQSLRSNFEGSRIGSGLNKPSSRIFQINPLGLLPRASMHRSSSIRHATVS